MRHFCAHDGCNPILCTRNTLRKTSNTNVFLSNLHFLGAIIKGMAVSYPPTPQNLSCLLNCHVRWSKLAIYFRVPNKHSSWSMLTPKTCIQPLMSAVLATAEQKTRCISSTLGFQAGPRSQEKREGQGSAGGGLWVTHEGKSQATPGAITHRGGKRKHAWERSQIFTGRVKHPFDVPMSAKWGKTRNNKNAFQWMSQGRD